MEEEEEGGSSQPPPYTVSDGCHPNPHDPTSVSPKPPPPLRPIEAFGPTPHSGPPYPQAPAYPGQMPPAQLGFGQFQPGYAYPPAPVQPYPQPYPASTGHQPFYPAYQMPYRPQHPQQLQQQQQQSVVVVGGGGYGGTPRINQPIVVVQSFTGQMFLACFVFWFCGWVFGFAAFVLAVMASSDAHRDPETARRYGRASMWVSVAGVIVGIVVMAIVVGVCVDRLNKMGGSGRNSYYYYY